MKQLKYTIFVLISLIVTNNTTWCMKQLSTLTKPVFSKEFKDADTIFDYVIISPDHHIPLSIVTLSKNSQIKGVIFNWKEDIQETIDTTDRSLDLYNVNQIHFSENYPLFKYKDYGSPVIEKEICLKKFYPHNTNHKEYKKELEEMLYQKYFSLIVEEFPRPGFLGFAHYKNREVEIKITKSFNNPNDSELIIQYNKNNYVKKISSVKNLEFDPRINKNYIPFTSSETGKLCIYDIQNKEIIPLLSANQYDRYNPVGPQHICIIKDNILQIFDLDTIQSKITLFKQKIIKNKKYQDINIITKK